MNIEREFVGSYEKDKLLLLFGYEGIWGAREDRSFLFCFIIYLEDYGDDLMRNHWGSFYLLPDLLLSYGSGSSSASSASSLMSSDSSGPSLFYFSELNTTKNTFLSAIKFSQVLISYQC